MLKTAAMLVMLVSAPALAQEGSATRTDFATLKKLFTEIGATVAKHSPGELSQAVASVSLSDEVAQALRAPRETRLKVAPR